MDEYIHIRCTNQPLSDSDRECGHSLGGIARQTLDAHDFERPFVDIRYCKDCHAYYRVIIKSLDKFPKIDMIGSDEKIDWVSFESLFPLVEISGRRIRK